MEPLPGEHADEVREIARQEIASLCGLVLRRLQEATPGAFDVQSRAVLKEIFGEALRDFGGTYSEPGQEEA